MKSKIQKKMKKRVTINKMISFIGLGNPGNEYVSTKHNAGFWVIDELCRRWKISLQSGKGSYVFAKRKNIDVFLMKPTTGMNRSGTAIKEFCNHQEIPLSKLHVIIDDIDLPLGKLRIRPKGGDGCHRGLESIIYQNGNIHFPRIRFGIAVGSNLRPSEDYVLKSFKKKDQILANEMIVKAADAAESILYNGLNNTMSKFNA